MPRWRDYYLAHDQTPHYEYLRTQLKALQFLRGGRRWLLKSPQHLEQLPVLDARLPRRDRGVHPPRPGAGGAVDDRDDHLLPRGCTALRCRCTRSRHRGSTACEHDARRARARPRRHPAGRARSTSASTSSWPTNSAIAERIYDLAGEPLTGAARAAMADYLDGHQRGRLGSIATSAEMFGLDERDLRDRFARYLERFLA